MSASPGAPSEMHLLLCSSFWVQASRNDSHPCHISEPGLMNIHLRPLQYALVSVTTFPTLPQACISSVCWWWAGGQSWAGLSQGNPDVSDHRAKHFLSTTPEVPIVRQGIGL